VVAAGGKQSQMLSRKTGGTAKTVVAGCDRLRLERMVRRRSLIGSAADGSSRRRTLLRLLTAARPGSERAANVWNRLGSTMLCSVAGRPPVSDRGLRVRGGGEMTYNLAGGIGLALSPTCLPPPLRFGWPVS
jgi:hypothetical protein